MTDLEVLSAIHALWPRMRLRNPSTPEEIEVKRNIRNALAARFGDLPRRSHGLGE